MLGYVNLLLDWSVPIPALRAELDKILREAVLWDDNIGIIQVRIAESTSIQVSALISAATPSNLIGLKFSVRERLIHWIQADTLDAVPHERSFVDPPDPLSKEIPAAGAPLPADRPDAPSSSRPDVVRVSDGKDQSRPTFRSVSPQDGSSGPHGEWRHGDLSPTDTGVLSVPLSVMRIPPADREPTPQTAPSLPTKTGYGASILIGSAGTEKHGKDFAGPSGDAMREWGKAARKKGGAQDPTEGDADGEGTQEGGENPVTETRVGAKNETGAKTQAATVPRPRRCGVASSQRLALRA